MWPLKTLWRRKFSQLSLRPVVCDWSPRVRKGFVAKSIYQSTSRIYVVSRQKLRKQCLDSTKTFKRDPIWLKDYREIILSQNVSRTRPLKS